MSSLQKAIKYLAMAFAIFLTVNIIGGITAALCGVSFLFSDADKAYIGEMQVYPVEEEISSLSLTLDGAKLKIKTADTFSVESNHTYISVTSEDGQLCIRETKKPFAVSPRGVTVILNIPEGFVFENADLETGAGTVETDALSADILKLSLGAGEVKMKNLTANTRAEIHGGAGALTIDGGRLCNLRLEMGVGELTLRSRIEGKSRLNYGIGETNLTLLGSRADYKIEIDKGIGEAAIAGENVQGDSVYGDGEHEIEVSGGIGEIQIRFAEDETQKAF